MMIQKATLHDLDALTELFDLYRLFYQQKSDLGGARGFLKERLTNDESMVFIAYDNQNPVGFVQLYPSFSSVSMKRSWLLNDLYVKEEVRGQGVGGNLLKEAIHFAASTSAKGVLLETAEDNKKAQRLYEKVGFKKESNYFYYFSI
ncbi:GNAT family N-acetyltransferase [Neobacillus sp. NPDC093127]|uniref:GNAT family N-acetyltransferase n=1 Tax=Neobacillus sp. NPDC093127 TaxID=3364296 RepID=UPI003819B2F0